MALDPQMQKVIDELARVGAPDLATLTPAQARALANARVMPPGPKTEIQDHSIPGPGGVLQVRVYRPLDAPGQLGGFVYFHGGGFVTGELDTYDPFCSQIAVDARCAVISVGYRLAPEHKFPAAVDDAYAATSWVHEHAEEIGVDHQRVAVGGDSAGATLATVTARLAKERRNPPLAFQLLFYPVTDLRSFDTPSYQQHATGKLLTRDAMQWYAAQYVRNDADRSDPRASPLCARNLIGLPPAFVVTAEHDPLCDEGEAYAQALRDAKNPVTLRRVAGVTHGFIRMYAQVDVARSALSESTTALRAALAPR